jgi:hypothetical protein
MIKKKKIITSNHNIFRYFDFDVKRDPKKKKKKKRRLSIDWPHPVFSLDLL